MLGRKETALEFGKAGTSSDITIHDKKARDIVRTWVVATGFPEKIPPLFHAVMMSEYVIFYVDALDKFAGEQIVALDMLGIKRGMLCHTYDVDEGKLDSMIRGTVVESYERIDASNLVQAVDAILSAYDTAGLSERPAEVVVDHCFDVKGVGTVILGRVASGVIRQYDTLVMHPLGADVLVKSIQMHDDPVESASYPARVGLAVKGPKPDDVQRGYILSATSNEAIIDSTCMTLDYSPSKFYKADLSEGEGCIVSVGLQTRAAIILKAALKDNNDANQCMISLEFAKPVSYHRGDTAVILKPEASPLRIAGSGRITG